MRRLSKPQAILITYEPMSKSCACDVTRREEPAIESECIGSSWGNNILSGVFMLYWKRGFVSAYVNALITFLICHRILRNEVFSLFFHAIPVCECLYHLITAVEGWISIQIEESDFFPAWNPANHCALIKDILVIHSLWSVLPD